LATKLAHLLLTRATSEPSITFAIEPKTRADEDKIGVSIHKILEEDPALRFRAIRQTKEFLWPVLASSTLKSLSPSSTSAITSISLEAAQSPYRETIRGKADVEGSIKNSPVATVNSAYAASNGAGRARQGVEFVDDVFGGAIPKNWIPSVEKGIRDAAAAASCGISRSDFRAILYDGKYHDVDSSDMAFKIAGSLAFKEAMKQARPALLEPVMHVEVTLPTNTPAT